MSSPPPRRALDKCPAFVPRKISQADKASQNSSQVVGRDLAANPITGQPIRLSSNESPIGASPAAKQAYLREVESLNRYPDGNQDKLRQSIAERFNLEPERIIGGNGSEELILLAMRTYIDPGDEVLVSENGFIMTNVHALAQGAELVVAKERDWCVNVDNLLARVTGKTRIVAIANPNNPSGTCIPAAEIKRLHAGLPGDVLLLLDAAYADYVVAEDFDSGLAIARDATNVMVTRTFSKLYGLAGLRIGWAYAAPGIVNAIQRIRTPFNTNAPAQAAAAAALGDTAHADKVRQQAIAAREQMRAKLIAMGIQVPPSVTNFLLMQFPEKPGKSALDVSRHLAENGIYLRPTGVSGPGDCLRVTVGLDHENEIFLDTLRKFLQ